MGRSAKRGEFSYSSSSKFIGLGRGKVPGSNHWLRNVSIFYKSGMRGKPVCQSVKFHFPEGACKKSSISYPPVPFLNESLSQRGWIYDGHLREVEQFSL